MIPVQVHHYHYYLEMKESNDRLARWHLTHAKTLSIDPPLPLIFNSDYDTAYLVSAVPIHALDAVLLHARIYHPQWNCGEAFTYHTCFLIDTHTL